MTNRERALNILNYKPFDRMPAVHFGYWVELLDEWADQGLIARELVKHWNDGNEADKELDKILGWDFNWANTARCDNVLRPKFEYEELSRSSDGFITYLNSEGLIEKKCAGASGIPAEVDYLLKDRATYERLFQPKFKFSPDRLDVKALKKPDGEAPLGLHLGSILGEVRNMLSVIGMSYTICDDYELLVQIIDDYADMQYRCAEETLKCAKFDFAHYWEDVCFKNGPLISPDMFSELCAKHYKKRNDLVRSYGIEIISLDCDGVIDKLLPVWFENGVNTIFPIEIGTWGDQFKAAREKYGKGLRGVGAVDKTALRKDRKAVDEELSRIVRLVKNGGFIPCPDHRLMPGTKFDLVRYYTEKIKEIKV